MDKAKAAASRAAINKVLEQGKDILQKAGISVQLKSGTFDDTSVSFKTICSDVNTDGTIETPERNNYKKLADLYNMKPEWLDQPFTATNGEIYILRGLNVKATKMPMIVERASDGAGFKMPEASIIRGFAREEALKANSRKPEDKPPASKNKPPSKLMSKKAEPPKKEEKKFDIASMVNNAVKEAV